MTSRRPAWLFSSTRPAPPNSRPALLARAGFATRRRGTNTLSHSCGTPVFQGPTPMPAPFQALLTPIATATVRELARQVQYLKAENRILRDRLPKCILVTARERQRLLRFGRPLGTAIKDLITIVTPRTFA